MCSKKILVNLLKSQLHRELGGNVAVGLLYSFQILFGVEASNFQLLRVHSFIPHWELTLPQRTLLLNITSPGEDDLTTNENFNSSVGRILRTIPSLDS
jgi:hypothetical protein